MQRQALGLVLALAFILARQDDVFGRPLALRAPVLLGRSLKKRVKSYRKKAKASIKRYGPQAVQIAGKLVTAGTGIPVDRVTDTYKQSVDARRAIRKAEQQERHAVRAYALEERAASLAARDGGSYLDGAPGAATPGPMHRGFVAGVGRWWNGLFGGERS